MPSKRKPLIWSLVFWALAACSSGGTLDEQEKAPLGQGSYGQAAGTNLATIQATDPQGAPMGRFAYDADQFEALYSAQSALDPLRAILSLGSGALQLTAANAQGRADTACRYQVGLLARDQGFDPGPSGWKTNQKGLELYWATASKAGEHRAYYCALLGQSAGISLGLSAQSPEWLEHKALFDLLHSLESY